MNNKDLMNHAADNIRLLAVSMVEKAKSGHPGGAMGGADFINVLFRSSWFSTQISRHGKAATASILILVTCLLCSTQLSLCRASIQLTT